MKRSKDEKVDKKVRFQVVRLTTEKVYGGQEMRRMSTNKIPSEQE